MELEKVIGSGKMYVSPVGRLTPAGLLLVSSVVALSFGLGLLGLGLIAGSAVATMFGLQLSGDTVSRNIRGRYLKLAEEFTPGLQNWNQYQLLYEDEQNAVLNKALHALDAKSMKKAIFWGKEYSAAVAEKDRDEFGGYTEYRLKFKGQNWQLVMVRVPSDVEMWKKARRSALKIKS